MGLPEEQCEPRDDVVPCWACRTPVVVPVADSQPVPVYACAWCGALTHTEGEASDSHRKRSQTRATIIRNAQRGILVVLVILISSIVGPGVFVALPELFEAAPAAHAANLVLTAWLTFNVVFNLVAATVKSAGPVDRYLAGIPRQHSPSDGDDQRPPRSAFQHHSFCRLCKGHKPPHAHHCSVCQTCVVGMDHHCPFLSNCVGTDNHRNFLLFLAWTIVSCLYVTAVSGSLLLQRWSYVRDFLGATVQSLKWQRALLVWLTVLLKAPTWLSTALYLLVVSVSLALGLGILLARQLVFLLRGISYVDALKMRTQGATPSLPSDPSANLRRVFGSKYVLAWPLPAWNNPPCRDDCKKGT